MPLRREFAITTNTTIIIINANAGITIARINQVGTESVLLSFTVPLVVMPAE